MKKRMSVFIDAKIARQAKQRAGEERRPLSDLIQRALLRYLSKGKAPPNERKRAYQLFCKQPMKIPRTQLRYVLQEDVLDS